VAAIGLVLVGCGGSSRPELELGRLAPAEVTDPAEFVGDDDWTVGVTLEDRAVYGRERVLLEFDGAVLECADGSQAEPLPTLVTGAAVQVQRADQPGSRRAVPPVIAAERLVVDCD
jgi:hypothetical protein